MPLIPCDLASLACHSQRLLACPLGAPHGCHQGLVTRQDKEIASVQPAWLSVRPTTRAKRVQPFSGAQVDLDTIEVSNLNRQFLFRRSHVGQSKASTAAQAVKAFRPHAQITAHQVLDWPSA